MTAQPTLENWQAERDAALAQVERNAGQDFIAEARRFTLQYLLTTPHATGEELTDACKKAGIVPENGDKAFGAVYGGLSRKGLIEKCGTAPRTKGHLCAGATLWRLKA